LEVYVVNGAHVKQLPGRKSDVADAIWLRTLHQHGLLRSGFVAESDIRTLRTYVHVRDTHINSGAREVQRMQKALELMGLKLHQVVSQIQGVSGMAIMEAILAGERDVEKLILLTHKRIRDTKTDQLREALKGNFRQEYLFSLQQAITSWRFHQEQVLVCDKEIEGHLQQMTHGVDKPDITDTPKTIRHHRPQIDELHQHLLILTQGKNPTQIEGINDQSLLKLISLTGLEMSAFPSEKHFVSYAGLTPCNDSSGKRKRRRRSKRGNPNLRQVFMLIARSVSKMRNELGEFYRNLKARRGSAIAMKALARKLAIRYYRIMKHGVEYVVRGIELYQKNTKNQKIRSLKKQMIKM